MQKGNMNEAIYHDTDLSSTRFLITGGAGFIGSHITEYLLHHGAGKVLVVDNLSTGNPKNIEPFSKYDNFDFHQEDVNDFDKVYSFCQQVDYVVHHAALGSVPRSIEDPQSTHHANATGFLSVLEASRKAKVKRLVYASSSSVYGDSEELPKTENHLGNPKSPYAITKLMNEQYARLYSRIHDMEIIGLRYFNIFGPKQNPSGPYAAAIPIFILAALKGETVNVYGDGNQSRDFTFVQNTVQANMKAMFASGDICGTEYNIACGERYSLNDVINIIEELTGKRLNVNYTDKREGDIMHSMANIDKASKILKFNPEIQLKEGMEQSIAWYMKNMQGIQSTSSSPIGQ